MKSKLLALLNIVKSKYFLSLLSNGTNAIIGMVTISVLLRMLSIHDMGVWGFFLTILLLVDTLRSGFLATTVVKFYSGSTDERKIEVVGSTWFIAGCITLVFILVNIPAYFASLYVENQSVTLFLKFFGLNYVLSLPFFVANCVLQAKQRYDRLLILNFSNQGSFLFFILILIFIGRIEITTVIFVYLLSNLLSSSLALIMGWSEFRKFKYRSAGVTREMFDFGKFTVGTSISSTLLSTTDSFIINFFLGPAALAIYNAGTKLTQIIEIPMRSFVYTAMPALSENYNSGKKSEVIVVMKKYIGIFTIAMLPIIILTFIFAEYAILLLGGGKYVQTEAPNILRIYMMLAALYPAERFFALTLDVIHLPKINFIKVFIMFIVVAVTDLIAIYYTHSIYGVVGASIFSLLTGLLIGYFALNAYYEKFPFWNIYQYGYREIKELIRANKAKFLG
jgi:O-antigen/teichoic acid export membrane protein